MTVKRSNLRNLNKMVWSEGNTEINIIFRINPNFPFFTVKMVSPIVTA